MSKAEIKSERDFIAKMHVRTVTLHSHNGRALPILDHKCILSQADSCRMSLKYIVYLGFVALISLLSLPTFHRCLGHLLQRPSSIMAGWDLSLWQFLRR